MLYIKRRKLILGGILGLIAVSFVCGVFVGTKNNKTEIITKTIVEPKYIVLDKVENVDFYPLSDEEYKELCNAIMAEAGGECYKGQMAVAQCILNACIKDEIRPVDVLINYKYTPTRKTASESVKKAVDAVFKNGEMVTDEEILYFYAPKHCKSEWHESQRFVMEIGGHRFFALK